MVRHQLTALVSVLTLVIGWAWAWAVPESLSKVAFMRWLRLCFWTSCYDWTQFGGFEAAVEALRCSQPGMTWASFDSSGLCVLRCDQSV